MFKVIKKSKKSQARLTELKTAHGKINGPFFMPIATRAAVKNLTPDELEELGAEIILSNTYHLMLAPGSNIIKKIGGLHSFMQWAKPILTDSGGFQVFSLARHRKISERSVTFRDPQNGQRYVLTPEKSIDIQHALGVDIGMALDDVIGYPATKEQVQQALKRTSRWAKRCLTHHQKIKSHMLLFGIVQGGIYKALRQQSAREITALDFDGYAVGGVAVGEPRDKIKQILDWVMPNLPEDKPRYLMGLGRPEEIIQAVKQGVDMFDCVIPTREARHGRLYLWSYDLSFPRKRESAKSSRSRIKSGMTNTKSFYKTINIQNAQFTKDVSPINNTNLKHYSKAYLHHLFKTNEPLGMRLATLHNLEFYLTLMAEIRKAIKAGKF